MICLPLSVILLSFLQKTWKGCSRIYNQVAFPPLFLLPGPGQKSILPIKPNKCSCPFPVFYCVRRQSFNQPVTYDRGLWGPLDMPFTSLLHCRETANIARLLLFIVRLIQSGLYLTVPCHRTATPRVRNGSRIWKLIVATWRGFKAL